MDRVYLHDYKNIDKQRFLTPCYPSRRIPIHWEQSYIIE